MKTDLLVIGGSAGGILAATTAKKIYKDKKVILVRKNKTVMVPCGIPYIFGTLKDASKNRIPDAMLTNAGIELLVDEVVRVDKEHKIAVLSNNGEISYDKLILATGSLPFIPKSIAGYDLKNVFPILKDEEYLNSMMEQLTELQNIVVVGGGFIGVEFAEQFKKAGKNVTIVEVAEKCLWQAFDDEYCNKAEEEMKQNGIMIKTAAKITSIAGNGRVEFIELENGETIKADAVIMGIGAMPNSELAKNAGIMVNEKGAIVVDEYLRTSMRDVFAVGDCAEKNSFFTGKSISVMLASTAAMEAKVAATNLYGLRYVRENKGTISAFSTKVFGMALAAAGLNERSARDEGFEIVTGTFSTMDKHPGSLPETKKIELKLLFIKTSGVLIGAEISGGDSVGEIINILSLAIQKGLSANELNTFQVATHPLLTASPIAYPINAAALNALEKMN
jgi:NADPH-dependent 2,4-dienoyl-CoA reductase/sulfur reductase-like enzyme